MFYLQQKFYAMGTISVHLTLTVHDILGGKCYLTINREQSITLSLLHRQYCDMAQNKRIISSFCRRFKHQTYLKKISIYILKGK